MSHDKLQGELTLEVNSLLKEKDLSLDIKDEAFFFQGWMILHFLKKCRSETCRGIYQILY